MVKYYRETFSVEGQTVEGWELEVKDWRGNLALSVQSLTDSLERRRKAIPSTLFNTVHVVNAALLCSPFFAALTPPAILSFPTISLSIFFTFLYTTFLTLLSLFLSSTICELPQGTFFQWGGKLTLLFSKNLKTFLGNANDKDAFLYAGLLIHGDFAPTDM